MKYFDVVFSFIFCVFAALFLGTAIASVYGVSAFYVVLSIFFIGVIAALFSKEKSAAYMAVQQEIWVKYIIDRLFKDNAFLKYAFNEDQYVIGGRAVHIPQPGAKPVVVKNRAAYPGIAVRRADTDILYSLDEYTTDPTHIVDADKVELSYDKIASVFGDHAGELTDTLADDMIIKWLEGIANFVPTSGADSAVNVAGQTGTRKAFVPDNLKSASLKFNLDKIPKNDRYALVESNMLDQLTSALAVTQYRDFSSHFDAANNVVGKLYGFNIIERSNVALASVGNVINPLGAAVAATDNVVALCWQKNSVTRAIGEQKFFDNTNRAEYYGDIYSALVRAGGRRRRAGNEGVLAIKQVA